MQEKITVFDESNIEAGRTYYRRAKQLVAKGRAAWHNSNKTAIRLTAKKMTKRRHQKWNMLILTAI